MFQLIAYNLGLALFNIRMISVLLTLSKAFFKSTIPKKAGGLNVIDFSTICLSVNIGSNLLLFS